MRLPLASIVPLVVALAPRLAGAESAAPPPPVEPVDILIVVDSTADMADERAALAETIDDFVRDLRDSVVGDYGTSLSLHLGFVTADLGAGGHAYPGCTSGGDGGRLRAVAREGCDGVSGTFLRAETSQWGNEVRNFEGEIGAAAACITPVALDGCGFQQPLGAAIQALTGSDPGNVGFLRDDAVLAVLVVTNQDDCSAPSAFFDPADTTLGPATPLRCAQQGWSCAPPIDGLPQLHGECTATAGGAERSIADLVGALESLKIDRSRIVVGTLRGSPAPVAVVDVDGTSQVAPSCGAGTARAATPGLRLDAFSAAFPDRATAGLVCQDGYGGWLAEVALDIRAAIAGDDGVAPPGRDGGVCDGSWYGSDAGETGGAGDGPAGCSAGADASAGGGGLVLRARVLTVRRRRRSA